MSEYIFYNAQVQKTHSVDYGEISVFMNFVIVQNHKDRAIYSKHLFRFMQQLV